MDTNPAGVHGPTPHDNPNPYAGAVDPAAIKRGHEADHYDAKSVLSVPLLVILFFVLAFGVVSLVFSYIRYSEPDPKANPWAVKQNEPPLNERINRIHRGGEVNQPRLEPLRQRTGDARAITRPETETGNSPELHPGDIIPSKTNTPELYESGWIDDNHTLAKIPIDKAMSVAVQKNLFPTQEAGTSPPVSSKVPTEANAGRGFGDSEAIPPKLPVPPKADPPKADPPKGDKK